MVPTQSTQACSHAMPLRRPHPLPLALNLCLKPERASGVDNGANIQRFFDISQILGKKLKSFLSR